MFGCPSLRQDQGAQGSLFKTSAIPLPTPTQPGVRIPEHSPPRRRLPAPPGPPSHYHQWSQHTVAHQWINCQWKFEIPSGNFSDRSTTDNQPIRSRWRCPRGAPWSRPRSTHPYHYLHQAPLPRARNGWDDGTSDTHRRRFSPPEHLGKVTYNTVVLAPLCFYRPL